MQTDKTEWIYRCLVTAAMVETILLPLFGFIVGPDYHKPSLGAPPALTEQQQRAAPDNPRRSHITTGGPPSLLCEMPALATAIHGNGSRFVDSTLFASPRYREFAQNVRRRFRESKAMFNSMVSPRCCCAHGHQSHDFHLAKEKFWRQPQGVCLTYNLCALTSVKLLSVGSGGFVGS
jgi:hypothetical protein